MRCASVPLEQRDGVVQAGGGFQDQRQALVVVAYVQAELVEHGASSPGGRRNSQLARSDRNT